MGSSSKVEVSVIVAAVEYGSDLVVELAARQASALLRAELHLVHVLPPPAPPSGIAIPPMTSIVDDGLAFLAEVRAHASELFSGSIATHLATGVADQEILALASELEADMVVVGAPHRGALARWVLGSVAQRVVNRAPCPVLVARPKERETRVPAIEPPCPQCVDVQEQTQRAQLWCSVHAQKHVHATLHYASPPSYGGGSMVF